MIAKPKYGLRVLCFWSCSTVPALRNISHRSLVLKYNLDKPAHTTGQYVDKDGTNIQVSKEIVA